MKYTENMELLLYDANDIMNTNDFVNQNNQKIDTFTAQVKSTAEEANAGQKTNASGITEINGKINTINQQLTDGELATLPQFKTDTDDRLEALEDTVNLTMKPEYGNWTSVSTGNVDYEYVDTIIGLYIINDIIDISRATTNNIPCKTWKNGSDTSYNYRLDVVKKSGNYFNIDINNIYVSYMPVRDIDSEEKYGYAPIGAYYNGVDTIICILSNANITTQRRYQIGGYQSIFGKSGPNKQNV